MADMTRERAGELVQALFRILERNPNGMKARDALQGLRQEVDLRDSERGEYKSGASRFEKRVRFATIPTVKAGWLVKDKGIWTLTEAGREALQAYPDPLEFMSESVRLYAKWRKGETTPSNNWSEATLGTDSFEPESLALEAEDEESVLDSNELPAVSPDVVPLTIERDTTGPVFKKVDYTLDKLIHDIDMGEIGLPDIQRPFVWANRKVRDLFDSMYRGYPVGYLLFWATIVPEGHRQVGDDQKQKVPQLLIVDGQQRLTSLYAVITGTPVVRENYSKERIQIAFNPVAQRFEVTDAAIVRDPEFIPDISELWGADVRRSKFVRDYLYRLRRGRQVSEDEEDYLSETIDRVYDLRKYPFTALELSGSVAEEQVAEIFVRINSAGTQLSQADFILTLMSVFWDKGRRGLEEFSRDARVPSQGPSSYNHFIQPDPDQLLRVSVGLAFRRARLQHVYSILRGKDLTTGEFSSERRTQQFRELERAQDYVLDLQNWHDFFKAIVQAGYRHSGMVSSEMGLIYSYLLFLIGKRDFSVDSYSLRNAMSRWFFMSAITGRYTTSPETVMERDLNRLSEVGDAKGFVAVLDRIVDETLTHDYWTIGLPNELASASPRSPSLSAYHAALVLLDARALFSNLKVSELFDPVTKAKKSAVERHHLFPKAYLAQLGIHRVRDVNQIANYALVEWPDNVSISATPPQEYWPKFASRFDSQDLNRMMYWHGLFDGWERLEYEEFLVERRRRMAAVVAEAFRGLGGQAATTQTSREEEQEERRHAALSRRRQSTELISVGENVHVEFKESARWSHIHGEKEKTSESEIVRAVAGFLNGRGGTLFIGVNDQGGVVGLSKDYKSIQNGANRDGFENWLTGILRDRLQAPAITHLTTTFDDVDGREICRIDVEPSTTPAYVEDRHFYLRLGNTTQELTMREAQEYIRNRWPRG